MKFGRVHRNNMKYGRVDNNGIYVSFHQKKPTNWGRIVLLSMASIVLTAATLGLMALWSSGCGEHYIDSKGAVKLNKCI